MVSDKMLNNKISDLLSEYKPDTRKFWAVFLTHVVGHKCTVVQIFGDAKNFCPNLILLSQITYKKQVLMSSLKRAIVKKSGFLHA